MADPLEKLEAAVRKLTADMAEVRAHILDAGGVADVHDLHAWTITSGMNVLSAHVVLIPDADPPAVLDELCRCLSGDFDIEHSTFQLESADRRRLDCPGPLCHHPHARGQTARCRGQGAAPQHAAGD